LRALEKFRPQRAHSFNQVDGSIGLRLSCGAGRQFFARGLVEMAAELGTLEPNGICSIPPGTATLRTPCG
jgi:hypothetical protein